MKKIYLLGVLLLCTTHSFCAIIYIKPNGSGNGSSWAQAYGSLTTALQNAQPGDELWVAQGIYKPSTIFNSTESFMFKNGVKVYGGFAGTETLLSERADTTGTTTILSGELSSTIRSEIILKVQNSSSMQNLLDGFTIEGASRTITSPVYGGGGVMVVSSTIVLRNVTVKDNNVTLIAPDSNISGYSGGAGIFGYQSNITLSNVDIINNAYNVQSTAEIAQVLHGGAGLMMHQGTLNYIKGRIQSNDVRFENFYAAGGGAYLLNVNNVYLQDLWVLENTGSEGLSEFYAPGAGLFLHGCDGAEVIQCVFSHNDTSADGDALALIGSDCVVTNVTFGAYGASTPANIVLVEGANVTFNNTVFHGQVAANISNTITYNNCVSTYGYGTGNLNNVVNAEMQFVDPRQFNFTPSSCSQQLNIGNNSFISLPYDINGNPRIVGSAVDPGAVELQHIWTNRVYVDAASTNNFKDGATWESAFTTIDEALQCGCNHEGVITQPAEIWVANGTYKPHITNELMYSTMKLNNNQKLYGGFTSGAVSLEDRDISFDTNQTVISGHIENDFYVYNAMLSHNNDISCEVNGFIFQDCNASHPSLIIAASGGAIQVREGSITLKNIWVRNSSGAVGGPVGFYYSGGILENIRLTDNDGYKGAGLYFFGSSDSQNLPPVHITNIEIINNTAGTYGGAVNIEQGHNVTIDGFTISGNSASFGGGAIYVTKAILNMSNGVFDANNTVQNGGAIALNSPPGAPCTAKLESVLFMNNTAGAGAAIGMSHSLLDIVNCTFGNNVSTIMGNIFAFTGGTVDIKNSIIHNPVNGLNAVAVYPASQNPNQLYNIANTLVNDDFSPVFTQAAGLVTNTDPQFIDQENNDYNLTPCGPGVDMGINSLLTLNLSYDAVGNPRIKNQIVDLGALEFQYLDISILEQPENVLTAVGQQVQFNVVANLNDLNYQWQVSTDGGSTWANIPNATGETLTVSPVTASMHQNLYRCTLSDCTNAGLSESAMLTISSLGLSDVSHTGLRVYPNPGNDYFTIQHERTLAGGNLTIYDVQGRVIYETSLTADSLHQGTAINSTAWASGIYWVQLEQTVVKFVKE